jgi:gamma-glutamylcyclotransferase (GGCT)/AIG2-like uncharacterized protein YtfP
MRGEPLHAVLAGGARLVAAASVRGRLLALGRYPGLVEGRGTVHGELYRLDGAELLPVLDREEGYNFVRRRTTVTLGRGRSARAWVYRYIGLRTGAATIPHGDWRGRPPARHHPTSRGDVDS